MGFTKTLRLDAAQTLGTTDPVELIHVYDATAYGSKERIGSSYVVRSGYGETIRIKIFEHEPSITPEILSDYQFAGIAPLVRFGGLVGRISQDKKGKPIICGEAESITLVSPPPPTRWEVLEARCRVMEASEAVRGLGDE